MLPDNLTHLSCRRTSVDSMTIIIFEFSACIVRFDIKATTSSDGRIVMVITNIIHPSDTPLTAMDFIFVIGSLQFLLYANSQPLRCLTQYDMFSPLYMGIATNIAPPPCDSNDAFIDGLRLEGLFEDEDEDGYDNAELEIDYGVIGTKVDTTILFNSVNVGALYALFIGYPMTINGVVHA